MIFDDDNELPQSKQDEKNLNQQMQKIQKQIQIKTSKTIKFDIILRFFNRIANLRGVKKGNYCRQFLKTLFKASREPAFVYSILRLILPTDDRNRGNYGLKQKGMAKTIADTLGLKKQDYERLYHYKNPNYHQRGVGIGDFSMCVFDVIKNFCKEKSQLTVFDLNVLLDQLALSNSQYQTVFRQLFQRSNAQQIKWITRIILKDLKLSIKSETVLNTFHKDASDYFNLTNSLLEVSKKFQNINISLNDQISVFNPIRPMLAGKKKISYFKFQNRQFYLQTKYDGQRIQAHWNGKQVQLFSRNAVNYSHVYKQIVDVLKQNLQATACILDGQVIVLQKQTLSMVAFGMNKVVALSNSQGDMQLCYKVFDIMWIKIDNQEMNMMKYSLKQRKRILSNVFTPIKGRLQLVDHKQISGFDHILQQFGSSIDRNQEGIMLKDPQSLYTPKQRGNSWLKLKGDYIDGLTDTLDLLILGGFFGDKSYRQGDSNHWTDKVTTFLLGVIDQNKLVYPFCKVGTGYTADQLALLRTKLKNSLLIDDGKYYPRNLKPWKFALQDKPDCWIRNLQKSVVFQVKAAEIIRSESYPTSFTLRFPRVVKIRYDKDWDEVMTLKQLQQMNNSAKYHKNMKKINDSDSDEQDKQGQNGPKKIKTQKQKVQKTGRGRLKNIILDDFKCVELGDNDYKKSNLFYGLQFVVLPLVSEKITRQDVQKQILLNGGKVSQNPLESTNYFVADHIDFRLNIYQSKNLKHILFVKPKYIFNCTKQQQLLQITPLYLTCLPLEKRQFYMQNYDRFSDSYTNYLNLRELDDILQQMPSDTKYPINYELIDSIGIKNRRKGKKSLCIGLSRLDIVKLKMHGSQIVQGLNFEQELYSIIVNGQLKDYEQRQLNLYTDRYPYTILQTRNQLTQISIL